MGPTHPPPQITKLLKKIKKSLPGKQVEICVLFVEWMALCTAVCCPSVLPSRGGADKSTSINFRRCTYWGQQKDLWKEKNIDVRKISISDVPHPYCIWSGEPCLRCPLDIPEWDRAWRGDTEDWEDERLRFRPIGFSSEGGVQGCSSTTGQGGRLSRSFSHEVRPQLTNALTGVLKTNQFIHIILPRLHHSTPRVGPFTQLSREVGRGVGRTFYRASSSLEAGTNWFSQVRQQTIKNRGLDCIG